MRALPSDSFEYFASTALGNTALPVGAAAGVFAAVVVGFGAGVGVVDAAAGFASPAGVADAWDSLTSLCIDLALPVEEAASELARHAGRRFDPAVVAACLLQSCPPDMTAGLWRVRAARQV